MRTAFFIVGSIAALAGWTNAIDLHSELDIPSENDTISDLDAKRKAYQNHQLAWGDKCSKVTN